jgi:cellobiose-specific phosphotransferase system component IIA
VALAEDLKVQRQHQGRAASGFTRSISRKNHGRASMLEPERWLPVSATSSIEQDAHGGQRELLILAARRQDFTVSVLHGHASGAMVTASPPSWPSYGGAGGAAFHADGHALAQQDSEVSPIGTVGALTTSRSRRQS